ncbi:TetR/AcrR family transcriptional regulator [Paludibacterium paludis]|uniref:HTH tetR-type domain-containing protein n=1 Tax=Paludibacterium paludis TaxID=1225769 RepID=A0A918UB04_9NEIS|nr:TetR/AcrR family transcriptional regulator [Paludibacterium paludis]GGY19813.1 hypothetical protein GCM10011289_24080 [Paludibacterium paludis]
MNTSSHPSNPTRQALLLTGLEHARAHGFRTLTVRGVCAAAGINTGSFVYHFGQREAFVAELIESWYRPLLDTLQWQLDRDADPLTRLAGMLRQLFTFASHNGEFIGQILLDAGSGEKAVRAFLRGLAPRHPQMILRCIEDAQAAGQVCGAPALHQLMFLMASLGMPLVAQRLLCGKDVLPDVIEEALTRFAIDTQCLEERLGWALRGLRPGECPS